MGIEIVDALAHRIGAGDGPRVRGTLQLPLPQAELDGVHGERRRAYQQRHRSRAHDQDIATFAPAEPIQRSEEHTYELQSLMRISYAVFCMKKQKYKDTSPRAISRTRMTTSPQ